MLAFENKNLWDCYFPLQPAKRILNAPDERFLTDGSVFLRGLTLIRYIEQLHLLPILWVFPFIQYINLRFKVGKLHGENLDGMTFPCTANSSSICTWVLCVQLPPEIQPEHQCHSDKRIMTGQAYQCQRQAALRDFDSALFPQLNRRLCFAKQTNKQGT